MNHDVRLVPATVAEEQTSISLSSGLRALASLLAPGTLICALMYYFGWVRTHALYAYLGIDADELGLSTTDYVLRSADALWPALSILIMLLLLLFLAHGAVTHWIDNTHSSINLNLGRRRTLPLSILAIVLVALAGIAVSAVGVVRFVTAQQASLETPLCLTAGSGLATYAWLLHGRRQRNISRRSARPPRVHSGRIEFTVLSLAMLFIVLNVFWGTALFADGLGQGKAHHLEADGFSNQPDVLVYSSHRLDMGARGVSVTDLGSPYTPYRFRYDGLKLLVRGNGRVILIPYSWSTTNAFAFVLPEDSQVRIVFAPNF